MLRWRQNLCGIIAAVVGVASCSSEMAKLPNWSDISPWRLGKDEPPPPETSCKNVAPGYNLHPVVACETAESYVLRIGEENQTYAKEAFQEKIKAHVYFFLKEKGYPLLSLRDAQLEVWVFSPTFNPIKTELKVLLVSRGGNVLFSMSPHVEQWRLSNANVTYLGAATYPEMEEIWYPKVLGTQARFFAFRFFG